MEVSKDVYFMMSEEVRKELSTHPGAFKAWIACLWEGYSAEEMYARAKERDSYGLTRATLITQKDLINKALDEYEIYASFPNYEN